MTVGELKKVLAGIPDDYVLMDYDYSVDDDGNLNEEERVIKGLCVYKSSEEVWFTDVADVIELPRDGVFMRAGVK